MKITPLRVDMNPELRSWHCPDIENLSTFIPENPENFMFFVQVFVGLRDQPGEESFNIEVFTPKWLVDNYKGDKAVAIDRSIIMFSYDYQALESTIKQIVQACSGETWTEIAHHLNRFGVWEFENYKEYNND